MQIALRRVNENPSCCFSPEARDDLLALYDWIADVAGDQTAIRYIGRLETYCLGFSHASERGQLRDDIRPNLRITGFERRIKIALASIPNALPF